MLTRCNRHYWQTINLLKLLTSNPTTISSSTTRLSSLNGCCIINLRQLSQSTLQETDSQSGRVNTAQQLTSKKPKLHWTEEFRIRSPKVPSSRLRNEPVVAIDIESDAFTDRRIAFVLKSNITRKPMIPRARGVGKIFSYIGLLSLPYLLFCKWAGGTPLLGEMTTYAIPATVAGVCLGYLGLNLAMEKAIYSRRIFSVALDEHDPELVYISTPPVGNWLHGQYKSYVTKLDNIEVDLANASRNYAKLTFKTGGDGLSFSLPISRRKCFIVDAKAMSEFGSVISAAHKKSSNSSISPSAAESISSASLSDLSQFEQLSLPSEREIDRHIDESLSATEPAAINQPTNDKDCDNQKQQSKN